MERVVEMMPATLCALFLPARVNAEEMPDLVTRRSACRTAENGGHTKVAMYASRSGVKCLIL